MTDILRKNWPIAKLNRITVYTEFSCCLALLGWTIFFALFPPLRGLPAVLLAIGLYVSILLHELGHVLVARHYKMEAFSLTLHGLGGYSQVVSRYKRALHLLEVSLAGPLANLCFFWGLSALMKVWNQGDLGLVFNQLRWANLILGLGALLPVTPLDGSHIAQAIHWQVTAKPSAKLPWMRSEIGNGFGILVLLLGLYCCSQSLVGVGMGLIALGFSMGSGHSTRRAAVQIQGLSSRTSKREQARTNHRRSSQKRSGSDRDRVEQVVDDPAPSATESPYLEIHCLTKVNESQVFQKGLIYAEDLRFADMIQAFTEALALDPNCAIAYHNRAYAYFQLDEYQQALVDFKEALRLSPNCAETYLGRGTTSAVLRDLPGAIMDFDAAIKLDSHHARAFFNRASAYLELGNRTAALADYKTAEALFSAQADSTMLRQVAYQLQSLDMDVSSEEMATSIPDGLEQDAPKYSNSPGHLPEQELMEQSPIYNEYPSGKVRNRLLGLLKNDQAAVDRLLEQVEIGHPGKTDKWYWEKVLWDLERDLYR
jgi:Zn-dependent protease/Flp pilus assembly protein TadD